MTRRLKASQLFALSIGLLALFAVAGFIAGATALDSLADSRRAVVDRIDPALVAVQEVQIALADQDTGVRGFALSGDGSFLDPYRRAVAAAPGAFARLQRTAGRRQAVQDLAAAARAWQSRYAEPTIRTVQGGERPTVAETREGKVLFDAFRARTAELEQVLNRERQSARHELADAASRVQVVVTAFTIAIFLAVVGTAIVLRRTIVAPISRLAGNVRATAAGDFGEPVPVDAGAREVVELGADVEVMRSRIVAELQAIALVRDDLQRSNAELEQFAYVASHDLQEPLRKVASFTQMLQRRYEGQLDERADQYIGFAVDGAKRMQDLINDLLAFSRVGRMRDAMVPVDLGEVVGHAIASQATRLRETDGRVDAGDLPTVQGEAGLLEVVFANLISNGIKFRREDEPPVVSVSAERRLDDWCFTVRDNGIGIEAEYADRIFVLFQRLHPRSVYDGTGIGLSMCRKIIEYHGGAIWLESGGADGTGTTFQFTLPAIEETA